MKICQRLSFALCAFVLACGCVAEVNNAQRLSREFCDPNGRVMVVSHRGDWHNVPENSIPAIANCVKNGIDVVEVDVQKTKDGHLILMHDKTVDRTTDGNGVIAEMTLAEIKKLRLKDYSGKLTEFSVPTLEEAMLTVKDKCLINLDKAGNLMPEALAVLKKTGTVNQAIFKGSKNPEKVNEILTSLNEPVIYVHIISVKGTTSPDMQQMLAEIDKFRVKPAAVELVFDDDRHPIVSDGFIAEVKKRGIRVWINALFAKFSGGHIDPLPNEKPVAWDWMLEKGASIIQTDYPVRLTEYLQTKQNASVRRTLRVMTYNVHWCEGRDGKYDLPRIAKVIADANADIVLLNEVAKNYKKRGNGADQPKELAELLKMNYFFAPGIAPSRQNDYKEFGNVVLSRLPIKNARMFKLYNEPSIEQRACAKVQIDVAGVQYTIMNSHFDHTSNHIRAKQAENILRIAGDAPQRTIFAGDLNCNSPSDTPDAENSKPIVLLGQKLKDTAEILSEKFCQTFVTKKIRIDYIFVSSDLARSVKSYKVIKNDVTEVASDHYPVVVELEM